MSQHSPDDGALVRNPPSLAHQLAGVTRIKPAHTRRCPDCGADVHLPAPIDGCARCGQALEGEAA